MSGDTHDTEAVAAFDVCGPLPSGTTVLEASAGTGKTFTIAALATRYVAEGHAELHELMLVTFGRAATQELRERVRERLVSAERGLGDPSYARTADDELLRSLADGSDDEVVIRRKRLTTALGDFDAATIATTHGFCQQMPTGLGLAGDYEPDATFVESVDDLVVEVVDDLYLRKWGRPDSGEPTMTHAEMLSLVQAAVGDRHARLLPAEAADEPAAERYRLAVAARGEVEARKRQRRLRDYDDLLTRLRDAMLDAERGEAARHRVRERYRVVMVDEFQDTDPVQWQILRLAFHGHTTLVLIGDPKQAIYAFRGGDVVTYLSASQQAATHQTLAKNWRSDEALLGGLSAVFGGAALGHPDIAVRPVAAAWPGRRLTGAPGEAPLRLRVATRASLGARGRTTPTVGRVRDLVAADLAADVVRLLDSRATITLDGGERVVAPGDIAALVHTNKHALVVRDALAASGVPAVLTGAVNVFSTAMAREWLVLLQALEQPHRGTRLRTAALGRFVGWDARALALAGDAALDDLGPLLRGWAVVLARRGVPALLEAVTEASALTERLIATPDGERQLTDLRHLAQVLHAAAVDEQLGTSALVEWLHRRITDSARDQSEERSRRLESDAGAVQVVTVHRSKGLEFPVVYVPFGWDRYARVPDHPRFHPEDGVRSLDVGGKTGPDFDRHCQSHSAEEAGEDLRVLYVALTRAQCQVVTWWAPSRNTPTSAMHRLLFDDARPGGQPRSKVDLPADDDTLRDRLHRLAATADGAVAVEEIGPVDGTRWQPATAEPGALAVAHFDRPLDRAWRRTSYSALTAGTHRAAQEQAGVTSEPEDDPLDDESGPDSSSSADSGAPPDLDEAILRAVPSPMAQLPGGTGFGLVVHELLETADAAAPDLRTELVGASRAVLARRLGVPYDAAALVEALLPALMTPLGRLANGLRLADITPADRLAEMDFELPLAGGDDPVESAATVSAIADLLRRRLPTGDPFASYADLLGGPGVEHQQLRGYLVGSLDAVLRLRTGDGEHRYLVVDYKTNWLGDDGPAGELSAWHYRPAALAQTMLAAHYPLQLLLYLVALHRYLRWRQPGYDPDRHLGGGLYLFVRGMCGPDTPVVDGTATGVFAWSPPPGLVEALSGLLAGERP
ncbi:exodeoxyribonuclease V subunit beta [soil metagenome]